MVSLVRRSCLVQGGFARTFLNLILFRCSFFHTVVSRCVFGLGDMGPSHAGEEVRGGEAPTSPRLNPDGAHFPGHDEVGLRGRALNPGQQRRPVPAASVSEELGRDCAGGNEAVSESRRAESGSGTFRAKSRGHSCECGRVCGFWQINNLRSTPS